MHGMVDIITEVMGKEEIKTENIEASETAGASEAVGVSSTSPSVGASINRPSLTKILLIVMVALTVIIAIILFNIQSSKNLKNKTRVYAANEVEVIEETDEKVVRLINDYFKAKTNLNFARVFSAFGRDYYEEERNKKDDNLKKIVNNLRYERIFVEKYDNIKIYSAPGLYESEKVAIVTYDMVMGYADTSAPMIMIFYLIESDGGYIIKDSLDVGTSKYIVNISNTDFVSSLYKDVEARLERAVSSSESLKLTYNTLRQIEVNQNFNLEDIDQKELIDNLLVGRVDLIRDEKEIHDAIVAQNEERAAKEKLDNYINGIIASWSDTLIRREEYAAEQEAKLIEAIERRKAAGLPY